MEQFEIVEYSPLYQEDAKDLLLTLQLHLESLGGCAPKPTFRDEYLPYLLREVEKQNGKIFLAVTDGKAIGLSIRNGLSNPKNWNVFWRPVC